MLDNINSSNDFLIRQSIQEQAEINSIALSKNATSKYAENNIYFEDKTDISDEAVQLFERDKDVKKFTKMVMDSFNEADANKEIAGLIESGAYDISDEDLSEKMLNDDDFVKMLFED